MRKSFTLSCAAVVVFAGAVAGCSGDGKGATGGMAGDKATASSSEVDELREKIAELEALLDSGLADTAKVQEELEAARDRLESLEDCDNGGDCAGLNEAEATLSQITDAYCEWLFGCCSEEEVRTGISPGVATVADCKSVYADALLSSSSNEYLPHQYEGSAALYGVGSDMGSLFSRSSGLADGVEKGHIKVNPDALGECVDFFDDLFCGDEQPDTLSCGENRGLPDACLENLFVGQLQRGQECSTYSAVDECDEGLRCGYGVGMDSKGICLEEPVAGDRCTGDDACYARDNSLYCDESVGECKERADVGETCTFVDSTFNAAVSYYSDSGLTVPCKGNLECSYETKKCVAHCEENSECSRGSSATWIGGTECADGLACLGVQHDGTYLANSTNRGSCLKPLEKGDVVGNVIYANRQCSSGHSAFYDGETRCTGAGGEECVIGTECRSGACDDGSCLTSCANELGGAELCGNNEYCSAEVCQPLLEDGVVCTADSQCLNGDCGADLTCGAPLSAGQSCDGNNFRCEDGTSCLLVAEATYECTAPGDIGDDCDGAYEPSCESNFCDNGTCAEFYGRRNGATCNWGRQCSSQRCNPDGDVCVSPKKKEGQSCDVENFDSPGTESTASGHQECEVGLFCERSKPGHESDFSGTCAKQLPAGSICDRSFGNAPQCEGDWSCSSSNDYHNATICPIVDDAIPDGEPKDGGPDSCSLYVPTVNPYLL